MAMHIFAVVPEPTSRMISSVLNTPSTAARVPVRQSVTPSLQLASKAVLGARASIAVRKAKAARRSADLLPKLREIQAGGATSLRQIAAILNTRRIPAARGGEWTAMQVWRVLAG
jgi:hypothetical protein